MIRPAVPLARHDPARLDQQCKVRRRPLGDLVRGLEAARALGGDADVAPRVYSTYPGLTPTLLEPHARVFDSVDTSTGKM